MRDHRLFLLTIMEFKTFEEIYQLRETEEKISIWERPDYLKSQIMDILNEYISDPKVVSKLNNMIEDFANSIIEIDRISDYDYEEGD